MDHFEKTKPSNQIPHQINDLESTKKQESFRQNASFAEKILLNEGMFTRCGDDHDIRKITRARIENMLYANSFELSETPVNIHIGRQGINHWIWENKVILDIPTKVLKDYLYQKMTNDAFAFYNEYIMARELAQKIAAYLKIPISEILDEQLMDNEVLTYLSKSFATTGRKQNLIAFVVQYAKQTTMHDTEKYRLLFTPLGTRKGKPVHPKIEMYMKQLTKEGKSELTIARVITHINSMLFWLVNTMKDFTACELHTVPILSIKEMHLQEFRSYLLKKQRKGEYSSITISECIYAIKSFFLFLQKIFGFPDPAKKIKSIKASRYRFRNLPTEEQIIAFFNVIEMYSENPLLECIAFQFMLTLGLRSMEVSQVSWNDINMGIRTICIHSKGGKHHELPLAGKLYRDLEIFQSITSTSKYLFGDNPQKSTRELQNNYKLYSLIAGWAFSGGLHLFRHCFVTNLAGQSPPPQALQALSRVVRMDTVSLYTHLNQKTNWLSQEINKLDYSYQGGK
ncbi:site-specific integrase [Paenibacillus sp. RC67]|uniref:tyrosine-type recombinase/integrase n=1 Tax=Paenibacillus sp. RC67 TaxID=3039392 RepID=UPI0024AE36F8|nr:site-specific integrase [Paenibacillus sp. RC67]